MSKELGRNIPWNAYRRLQLGIHEIELAAIYPLKFIHSSYINPYSTILPYPQHINPGHI